MRLWKKLSMRLYKKIFLVISLVIPVNLAAEYEISINYESGFEFTSQKLLFESLQKESSRQGIENLIQNQDWIKDYSITFRPFKKKIFISIKNREPIFILNDEYYYDKDLIRFGFDKSKKKLIMVHGDIDDLNDILLLINNMELNKSIKFKVVSINYSYVNGWDVQTDSTLIRFGKNISDNRLKNFHDTVNYLYENRKIPSIIDMRYKDGAALSYGK